jgi:hypothetical protein
MPRSTRMSSLTASDQLVSLTESILFSSKRACVWYRELANRDEARGRAANYQKQKATRKGKEEGGRNAPWPPTRFALTKQVS